MNVDLQPLPDAAKPFLRWAGSKRKQLGRLSAFWGPHHQRYIEPFCGSACLFFRLTPTCARLGDKNNELIELFSVVRDSPLRLHRRLIRLKRDLPTYLRWRGKDSLKLDPETRALRFLYLNRNCFNGIYRTNAKGVFNVPMGTKLGPYPSLEQLVVCSDLLKSAELVAGDFQDTVKDAGRGDFVYLDPPYAMSSQRLFIEYGKESFNLADIPRFADDLLSIHARGADFLVSYADCVQAQDIAKQWNSVRLPVKRSIAGFTSARIMAYEWLISNQPIPAGIAAF